MDANAVEHHTLLVPQVRQPRERRRAARGSVASRTVAALAWVLFLSGVLMVGLRLAGYQFISARGSSMEPAFSAGSLLLVRPAAPDSVRIGDIVAIPRASEAAPRVVHRVVALLDQGEDVVAFTMGDNNAAPDPAPTTLDRSVARVVWMAPYAGWWVTPTTGWLLLGISGLLVLRAALGWAAQRMTYPRWHRAGASNPAWWTIRFGARSRSYHADRIREVEVTHG